MSHYKDLDMLNTFPVIIHHQEPQILIPITLLMDIYAILHTLERKDLTESIKSIIKGVK